MKLGFCDGIFDILCPRVSNGSLLYVEDVFKDFTTVEIVQSSDFTSWNIVGVVF